MISGFPQCWVLRKLEKTKQYFEPFAMHSDCEGCNYLSKLLTKERVRQTGRIVIEDIRCVQNVDLYRKYSAKKSLFILNSQKRNYSKINEEILSDVIVSNSEYSFLKEMLSLDLNERFLFYETTPDAAKEICKSGFQLKNLGRLGNIMMIAPGILFTDSLGAQNQAHNNVGTYSVIASRVLLGNSLPTQNQRRNIIRLPCMYEGCLDDQCAHRTTHGSFDSIVIPASSRVIVLGFQDRFKWHDFVICDPEQCYPNFLIKFKIQQ